MPHFSVPTEVIGVTGALQSAGFEAFIVGGCVRDLARGATPKDWDVTTNARPEHIQATFEHTFYNNDFGTVGVVTESEDEALKVVEVTPYRREGKYSDVRRPDEVVFTDSLEEDLKRRDFTINAMAYDPAADTLVDRYDGAADIDRKLLRVVGDPRERFSEDALRMMRAIRLAAELDFTIESETAAAIHENSALMSRISSERIRDELIRILMTSTPMDAFIIAHQLGLLAHILPDLERGIGIDQNQAHSYTVFEHNLRTMQHAADQNWNLDMRLAGLMHDISKPETRRWSNEKGDWTFHGHDVVGARVAKRVLGQLKFPKEMIDKVVKLVRWHMFFSDPDQVTLSAVRRTIRNVGEENIWDLLNLRVCDRIGTGRPKAQPFRLRKYISMVEEALRDPVSVTQLPIDGGEIMKITNEAPGPRVGWTLHALLEEVLDDPKKAEKEALAARAVALAALPDAELRALGEAGKKRIEEEEAAAVKQLREKYHVS